MANEMDWQRQSFAKGGKAEAPIQRMDAKVSGRSTTLHSKIAKPTVAYYADGGEVTEASDKEAGLKASAGEDVGFFKRLSMGNIDEKGSEAYNQFGAGRGEIERIKARADDGSDSAAETARFKNYKPAEVEKPATPEPAPAAAPAPEPKYGRDSARDLSPSSPASKTAAAPASKTSAAPAPKMMSNDEAAANYKPRYTPPVAAPKQTNQARPIKPYKSLLPEDDYTKIR